VPEHGSYAAGSQQYIDQKIMKLIKKADERTLGAGFREAIRAEPGEAPSHDLCRQASRPGINGREYRCIIHGMPKRGIVSKSVKTDGICL